MIKRLLNWFFTEDVESLKLGGKVRSSKWNKLRDDFLKGKVCIVCGRKDNLIAHHVKPFNLFPELELEISNLLPICERPTVLNCHLIFAHLGDFRNHFNPDIIKDAKIWSKKLQS